MDYTVAKLAALAGVTVKTLHHYHKLGLLVPGRISQSGYRLYGEEELLRLQQILFFRALAFPLADIKTALDAEDDRLSCLLRQRELLLARKVRLDAVLDTLEHSIQSETKGAHMAENELFSGLNEAEWREALAGQTQHLKEQYGYNPLEDTDAVPSADEMNEQAAHAAAFMASMVESLRTGKGPKDAQVQALLAEHLAFLNEHDPPGGTVTPEGFVNQTQFFMEDDFHRSMMEGQQVGLCYYLYAVAEANFKL